MDGFQEDDQAGFSKDIMDLSEHLLRTLPTLPSNQVISVPFDKKNLLEFIFWDSISAESPKGDKITINSNEGGWELILDFSTNTFKTNLSKRRSG